MLNWSAVPTDFAVTQKDDGKVLFRWGTWDKRPTDVRLVAKIPLPEDWIPAYREYLSQYQPVDQLFPWSPRRLEYLLEDISEEAALDKHLSFDMCRWTSTLIDYRIGMEPDKIRQKLGISKIQWREINLKLKQLSKNQG